MRAFLPWTSHLLPAVAARMIADHAAKEPGSHDTDLSEWLVVVRGRAASRRLLALLAIEAQRAGRALIPPSITTLGQLDEEMFGRPQNVAGTLTQRLAWAAALERAPDDLLAHVWHAPEGRDHSSGRRNLASFLERTWRELSVSGTDFAGAFEVLARLVPDVADIGQPRWIALQRLLDDHRAILGEWGLIEPAAWRTSLLSAGRAPAVQRVALVGIVELPPVLASLLALLKNDPLVFIHAPESEAAGFDEWGRLKSAHWAQRGCRFANGEIHVVRGVREQAVRCAELIRAWKSGGLVASAITVAVSERGAISALQQGIADAGIPARTAEGLPLSRSSMLVLLSQFADFWDRDAGDPPTYESVAALARHPDLRSSGNFLAEKFDGFFEEHLPVRIDPALCKNSDGDSPVGAALVRLERLATIRGDHFVEDITRLLITVYGDEQAASHTGDNRTLIPALESIRRVLDEFERLPRGAVAQFSPADLLRLLVEIAGAGEIPEPEQPDAVELAGWLEAASDDAPALIITSVFDGSLPEGAPAEPLLLDSLREKLGLPCRASRFARDQFTLHSVWMSRREHGRFALIAPRRTVEGTPARPSRLLLGAHADRELAARLLALVAETHGAPPPPHAVAGLRPPDPDSEKMRAFRTFRVTSFRTYLASPRLFYFQHVCRLKVQDDSADELDAGAFGSAIHSVLEAFGECHLGIASKITAAEIERETTAALHDFIRRRYGRHPLPPVIAQVHSLEERLRFFADEQARLFAEGWEIAYVEKGGAVEVPFAVPGAPDDVSLKGRIDRVDRHRDGRLRVMDYKTSSTAKQPTIAHFSEKKHEWRDLQLPLYVKLLPALGLLGKVPEPGDELELVYFNLPPKRDEAHVSQPFDPLLIPDAWERAAKIIAEVCSGDGCREVGKIFGNEDPVFRALCGTNGLPVETGEEE
jgi:ATP-dependent helicase/nuclease subunit B